jgi:DNA-binding transcriptional LysR family regulator
MWICIMDIGHPGHSRQEWLRVNIRGLDLNLLVAFDALMRERNVTRAGQAIGLAQPSMSNALARLRKVFGDPLFVPTRQGMEPTPYAQRLAGPVREGLATLTAGLEAPSGFDPGTSTRRFTLLMSDIGEIIVLPRLAGRLKHEAPGVELAVASARRSDYRAVLESGDADLAIGHLPELTAGFLAQRLFGDHHVCMVRRDHPSIGAKLTLADYLAADHVQVTTSLTDAVIDQELAKKGRRRKVALRVPQYLVVAMIAMNTDLLVTVPSAVVGALPIGGRVRTLPLPFRVPAVNVRQFWHRRFDKEPGSRWLRGAIAALFANASGAFAAA